MKTLQLPQQYPTPKEEEEATKRRGCTRPWGGQETPCTLLSGELPQGYLSFHVLKGFQFGT